MENLKWFFEFMFQSPAHFFGMFILIGVICQTIIHVAKYLRRPICDCANQKPKKEKDSGTDN